MYKTTKEENLIMKDIDKNYQDMSGNELLDMKKKAKKLASNYFKKKTISIRINENNLEKIKGLAIYQNMPYQTLINVAINKYIKESVVLEK